MPLKSELEREVHLWFWPTARLEESNRLARAADLLSDEEKRRADRFRFEKDQRSYIAAHALVRAVLSEYVPVSPTAWEFEPTLMGKPAVTSPPDGQSLRFNLSHSAGMAACAVTRIGEVGVDVETVHSRECLKIARRFFAPEEVAQLESLPAHRQTEAFFRFWTLKEAYIKARGLGLSLDLAGFFFPDVMRQEISIGFREDFQDDPGLWTFHRHEPDAEHQIAVALRCPRDRPIAFRVFHQPPQPLQ